MGELTAPRNSDMLKPAEIINHLLIVRPLEFIPEVQTTLGPKDAMRCDVVDLHQNNADGSYGVVFNGVLWFGRQLIAGLKQQMGDLVLGWMQQGISKPGQNPPFLLTDAMGDTASRTAAQGWLDAHPGFDTASAATAQAPATPGAPPAAPSAPQQPATAPTTPLAAPGGPAAPATPAVVNAAPAPAQGATVLDGLDANQRAALAALGFNLPA